MTEQDAICGETVNNQPLIGLVRQKLKMHKNVLRPSQAFSRSQLDLGTLILYL